MGKETTITEHQAVLMELWHVLDAICEKHCIRYQLFAGSALGAVRHRGIIPWDDDLDVVMLREDYNRFMEVAALELDTKRYFLQREFSEHWPMFFSKLRKNKTACIERYISKDWNTHMGVYIDIFPCDNLSDNPVKRRMQFLVSKIVIAKSLYERGYLTNNPLKKAFMCFCKVFSQKVLYRFVVDKQDCETEFVHTFFAAARSYQKNIFPRTWFEESVILPFGNAAAPVSSQYDDLLTRLYGDYMTPLPEDQRGCKVHAEIVDLDRSYEAYKEMQSTMRFKGYTRSIR